VSGRVALVTGGAGAIGSAIVARLEEDGHQVVVVDRAGSELPSGAASEASAPGATPEGGAASAALVAYDLSSEVDARAAAREVLARHGRCDVLVHAAAAFDQAGLDAVDAATWRRVQAVNVEAALWLCQELVPGMRERRFGRVVFVTSDTVWKPPVPELLPYVTSKAGLEGMGRALAIALGADGITVNCVAPGLTDTPAAREGMPAAAFDGVRAAQALDRTLVPDDVAATVAYLATDRAEALTGQTLSVDGGLVLR
jgi:NAD(P)-dependent dehydrogenase (short-subunit alcohol dehydrogenase family)